MEVFMVKMTEEHMWSGLYIINYTQPMAKLCVGLMQAWMILELSLRMRHFTLTAFIEKAAD